MTFDNSTNRMDSLHQSLSRSNRARDLIVRSPSISRYATTLVSTSTTLLATLRDRCLDALQIETRATAQAHRLRQAVRMLALRRGRHAPPRTGSEPKPPKTAGPQPSTAFSARTTRGTSSSPMAGNRGNVTVSRPTRAATGVASGSYPWER